MSRLKGKDGDSVFIDFENARPSSNELEIFNIVQSTLERKDEVMQRLQEYKGCQDLARKAMSAPTPENELAAFEGLLEAVESIQVFFNYAKELERVVPELLTTLAKDGSDCKTSVADQQALAKQLADIFDFALRFDALRMLRPFLPNDFSYYRRLLPKFSKHERVKVKDDEASGMALFTPQHIPMMTALATATAATMERNEHVTSALAIMANSCHSMLKAKKFSNEATVLFCARAMTGAIVLYDHADPSGVFHKKTKVAIKPAIQLLKKDIPAADGATLLNALQFSTKHFKEAPDSIQELFQSSA